MEGERQLRPERRMMEQSGCGVERSMVWCSNRTRWWSREKVRGRRRCGKRNMTPPMDIVTAPCHILFYFASTPLHYALLYSPIPFLFHSTFMSILLSPCSVLISAPLYWLDKIPFMSCAFLQLLLDLSCQYLVILNVYPTCIHTYLCLSWHMYSVYCYLLLCPLLHFWVV